MIFMCFSLSHNILEASLCLLLHGVHLLHQRRDDVPGGKQFCHHISKHINMLIVSVDMQHILVLLDDGECFAHVIFSTASMRWWLVYSRFSHSHLLWT